MNSQNLVKTSREKQKHSLRSSCALLFFQKLILQALIALILEWLRDGIITVQKMKFSIKDFSCKYD